MAAIRSEALLESMGLQGLTHLSVDELPFAAGDATAGSEDELQAVVAGRPSDCDLPFTIRESRFFRNIARRQRVAKRRVAPFWSWRPSSTTAAEFGRTVGSAFPNRGSALTRFRFSRPISRRCGMARSANGPMLGGFASYRIASRGCEFPSATQ